MYSVYIYIHIYVCSYKLQFLSGMILTTLQVRIIGVEAGGEHGPWLPVPGRYVQHPKMWKLGIKIPWNFKKWWVFHDFPWICSMNVNKMKYFVVQTIGFV